MYNLTTKQEIQITTEENDQCFPDIYGNYIVWVHCEYDENIDPTYKDIHIYNLETQEMGIIAEAFNSQTNPSIFGNYIVWEDYRYFRYPNIFYYDLSQDEENYITQDSSYNFEPDIYANKVVWEESYNILFYNLDNGEEIDVSNSMDAQEDARIFNNVIVWVDHRNKISEDIENTDIYAFDLVNEKEIQISYDKSNQSLPAIYEDKIVCMDTRYGGIEYWNWDIFLYYLPSFDNGNHYNHEPIIESISATPNKIKPNEAAQIEVRAIDEDGDMLSFYYECTGGSIQGETLSVIWTAPEDEGLYTITVTVSDGILNSNPKSVNVTVEKEKFENQDDENQVTDIDKNNIPMLIFIIILIVFLIAIYFRYKGKNKN
jgi:beta propeller repeat protein